MTQNSFVGQLVKSGSIPIHLVRCKDPEDRDCYYFVMCSHERIKMLHNVTTGMFDIHDYGKIIASGVGREPSDAVKQTLRDDYDFDAESLL